MAGENPIRKIVNLLQMTQKKIEEEGEAQGDMFEKFMCYCETNDKKLGASITSLTDAVPQNEASVKSKSEQKTQMEEELKVHKKDREDANAAIEASEEQRAKDKSAFDAYSTEAKTNLAAMKKAVAALRKGMGEAFLQSGTASTVLKLAVSSTKLSAFDQNEVTQFLQGKASAESSGEIVGILEQMAENMAADLKEAEEQEAGGISDNDALVAAKNKEIAAATSAVEDKTGRVGELAVAIVNAKNDLEDTKDALAEDTAYAAELKKTCAEQTELFGQVKKMRAQELEAIGSCIKILNDDDALDLFKKTLPSPSLVQQDSLLQISSKVSQQQRVRALLKEAQHESARVGDKSAASAQVAALMQLALTGKKAGFEKIIKMMDDMVELLGKEQKDDEQQKAYCEEEFERSEDEDAEIKRVEAEIAEGTDAIAGLKDDIAALIAGIADLDKAVAEATETRKEESSEYTITKTQNSAAVQLLDVAKNQLNKFYSPTLYKAPERRELTEEERIYVNSGGEDPRDAEEAQASGNSIGGSGVTVFAQMKMHMMSSGPPPPPPMAVEAYKKSDSSGPVALLEKLQNELKMEMQEDDMEEKTGQKDYEEMMGKSAEKRAVDSKTIVEKETQKAEAEALLASAKKEHKAKSAELMALSEYVMNLHASCDFLVKNFDTRKEARSNEIDAIKKAKAVLSGADFSLMQTGAQTQRLGFLQKHADAKSAQQCDPKEDEQRRMALFQSLTQLMRDANDACVEMCKNTGAYPNCACPRFEPPDSTPGVVTWDELYDHFDSLKDQGREMLKKYHKISQ